MCKSWEWEGKDDAATCFVLYYVRKEAFLPSTECVCLGKHVQLAGG